MRTDLGLISGYGAGVNEDSSRLGFRRMFELALQTWPYMRPMLKHLVVMGVVMLSGGFTGILAGIVGTDLLSNKVLVGAKLQPLQAKVLFLGPEYVTADPQELGRWWELISIGEGEGHGEGEGLGEREGLGEGEGLVGDSLDSDEPQLTPEQRRTVRNRLLIWGAIGGVFAAAFFAVFEYYTNWIWQCINQNLRVAMVDRAESLSLRYYDDARVGDAMFRVYQDSAQIVNLLRSGIMSPVLTLYGIVVGLVFVAAFDPLFALIAIVAGVPICWLTVVSTGRIRRRALANRKANSNLTSRAQEVFSAIKVVKAHGAEPRVFARFSEDSVRALNTAYFFRLDMALVTTAVAFSGCIMLLASEYIMVTWVVEERETFLGAMVAGLIGFVLWNFGAFQIARGRIEGLHWGARGMLGIWMQMQDLFIALDRAFYLLDLEPEVADPDTAVDFPAPIERVAWRGVHFGYREDRPLLKDIDLEADAGTATAIVGTTGSGKSTLMSLLLRLYDPDRGRVEVNGVDLRDMLVESVRSNTAIALQKNVLFADTVANNIAFGSANAERTDIENAARIACCEDFIGAMPKGFDTELGERGGKLSAGQRQRLSIARAVLRDPPILILDEPTASLDARTEQEVLRRLADWGRGRIIFVVTHRLSTIRGADRIALLEDGRIAETGNHDELMAREDGRYRAFVEAELVGSEGTATEDVR